MTRVALILGYGAFSVRAAKEAARQVSDELLRAGKRVEIRVISPYQFTADDEAFLRTCTVVFAYFYPSENNRLYELVKSLGCKVVSHDPSLVRDVSARDVATCIKCYSMGGVENLKLLIKHLVRIAGVDVGVLPEPKPLPWSGIYHPRLGTFTSLTEYLRAYGREWKCFVGILFYRSEWLYGNTGVVDALVRELEARGIGAIPVFTYQFSNRAVGSSSAEEAIERFFFLEGKPIVDCVIDLLSFFVRDRGGTSPKNFSIEGSDALKRLGVPVLKGVKTSRMTVGEWLESDSVDFSTQVYEVIMPELDGVTDPILVSCVEVDAHGAKVRVPYDKHVKYLVDRVEKLVELRRKPPSERKIAIVLINPPCKGAEANVGVGMGLDVHESVVRFLKRLRELGYKVEGVPNSGKELIRLIMERRAVSEFRWTSVEEIVARGGALDFVDAETYMKWFMELPEDARKRLVEVWGDPRDVLEGRAKELAGMVYRGKFVVPGVRFGNVVVLPQPKRGCAGARCDGRVCKILHDPTVPPPHQWIAVYKWLERVFRADLIIHFGTHGYLEFLPGKGVGLSPSCWPEISIGRVPHLYVYVVSNPMEGCIAKRRGYATIVDHLYPPLAKAKVEEFERVKRLVAEFKRARELGDVERAKVVYEQLVDECRRLNISVDLSKRPDEVVEDVHEYITAIESTQVNLGLHVIGGELDNAKIAEYCVNIMFYDTHFSKSILRAVAEVVGVDYDEVIEEPSKLTKFNITGKELQDILYDTAVEVLKKLLDRGVKPEDLREDELVALIREEFSRRVASCRR